jgi:double-stranded uracil-DNA glycosylase
VLDDILREGLKLVICGTAAGTRSAQLKHYYAGPGNKFWSVLAELKLTPRRLAPSEANLLLDFGIGLTDLVKGQSGADSGLRFDGTGSVSLREKMTDLQPRILCFNGKRAAQEYLGTRTVAFGVQEERIGNTALFVAPSTSGAANGSWDLSYWHDLADRVVRDRL